MPVKVADTRTVGTIEDARRIMSDIRRHTCERELIVARAEKSIARITAKADDATAPIDAELLHLGEELSAIILANKDQFLRPRMMTTPDGKFGLRTATRLDVYDEDAALDCIFDRGYDDCIKTTRRFVKEKIAARLLSGETIKGCRVNSGDIASYSVSKALVQEARENA